MQLIKSLFQIIYYRLRQFYGKIDVTYNFTFYQFILIIFDVAVILGFYHCSVYVLYVSSNLHIYVCNGTKAHVH